MSARYLVRFDDICPTMNWDIWSRIEVMLVARNIKPILAVIPDNQDEKLAYAAPRSCFWEEVRGWQARGWTIGLHGYQHLFVNQHSGILRIQRRSEFAGLPPALQLEKLQQAMAIFHRHGVEPELWVAPNHSFDVHTMVALQKIGLTTMSDGFALAPHTDARGLLWIPQQLWAFRYRPFGVWTVCHHHNPWTDQDLNSFERNLAKFRSRITDVPALGIRYRLRRHSFLDSAYGLAHRGVLALRTRTRASA